MPVRGGGTNRNHVRSPNVTLRATRTRRSARVSRTLPSSASNPSPPPVDNPMLLEDDSTMLLEDGSTMLMET